MSVRNFVPEIWSRDILFQFRKMRAMSAITNTNYQGEITQQGDTVRITTPSSIAVKEYNGSVVYDSTDSTQQSLLIDQSKYFAFSVDDVDAVQANVELIQPYTEEGGQSMADDFDEFVAGFYTGATTDVGGAITASNVYETVVEARTALSDLKVPMSGRVGVVSPGFMGLLLNSPEFIKASDLGDAVVQSGAVGRIAGFTIFEGNSVIVDETSNEVEHNLFGHPAAITVATQLVNVEALRLEGSFSDAIRGLTVYGGRVVRPDALVDLQRNTA